MKPDDEKLCERIEKLAKHVIDKPTFESHFRQKLVDGVAGPFDDFEFLFDGKGSYYYEQCKKEKNEVKRGSMHAEKRS